MQAKPFHLACVAALLLLSTFVRPSAAPLTLLTWPALCVRLLLLGAICRHVSYPCVLCILLIPNPDMDSLFKAVQR